MHDALLMEARNRRRHLGKVLPDDALVEAGASLAGLAKLPLEVARLRELEHQYERERAGLGRVLVDERLVEGHDVPVGHPPDQADLSETLR